MWKSMRGIVIGAVIGAVTLVLQDHLMRLIYATEEAVLDTVAALFADDERSDGGSQIAIVDDTYEEPTPHANPMTEFGGTMHLFADGAVLSKESPGCALTTYNGTNLPYRALNCSPGAGQALWQLPWPVGDDFTYRVHYSTATTDVKACKWNVAALPDHGTAVVSVSLNRDSTTTTDCSLRSLEIRY